jgi:hypothetical protein
MVESVQGGAPRAFLSHATADKVRFVLPFAEHLRHRGIDVWLDGWELLPGDSLVKKIFAEGIENADAVIIVISSSSQSSRWVAEELDAAVVKRINTGSRLIPIVLDGLSIPDVPVAIRHLVIEFVPDTNQIDAVVDRVTRSIFGVVARPALGNPPAYANSPATPVDGLDQIDSIILKLVGDEAVRDNGTRFNTQEFVDETTSGLGVTAEQVIESLRVLDADNHVDITRTMGSGIPSMSRFTLTLAGAEAYLAAYCDDYRLIQHTVIARLVDWPADKPATEATLSESVGAPRFIVDHILTLLERMGLVTLSARTHGGQQHGRHFFNPSPKLRRMLDR